MVKKGRTACWLSHAAGRRQASLGTPVPRTPTVAPGPKVRSGLASWRIQGPSTERRRPPKHAASIDAWCLIGRGRLRFPMLPLNPPGYAALPLTQLFFPLRAQLFQSPCSFIVLLRLPNPTCAPPASPPWRRNKSGRGRNPCPRQLRLHPSSRRSAGLGCSTTRPWTRCAPCLLPVSTSGERRQLGPRLTAAWRGSYRGTDLH